MQTEVKAPETAEDVKSYATRKTYEGYLRRWILPRWRSYRLTEVKAVEVERWLKPLPLALAAAAHPGGVAPNWERVRFPVDDSLKTSIEGLRKQPA